MYQLRCKSPKAEATCRRASCVYPVICQHMNTDHTPTINLYRRARDLHGIKKILIASGVRYLRIEGAFYFGIGCLFLLYGYYRAIKRAEMSVVLTVISLGIRVLLAYVLSATFLGETGIWMAIPIGWILADLTGLLYMRKTW